MTGICGHVLDIFVYLDVWQPFRDWLHIYITGRQGKGGGKWLGLRYIYFTVPPQKMHKLYHYSRLLYKKKDKFKDCLIKNKTTTPMNILTQRIYFQVVPEDCSPLRTPPEISVSLWWPNVFPGVWTDGSLAASSFDSISIEVTLSEVSVPFTVHSIPSPSCRTFSLLLNSAVKKTRRAT